MDITVLVAPGSGGAVQLAGERSWTGRLRSNAWRDVAGNLRRTPFVALLKVSQAQTLTWDTKAPAYSVVKLTIDGLVERDDGSAQCRLSRIHGAVDDVDLADISKNLQRPVTFEHPVLGALKLDRALDWFEGDSIPPLPGVRVHLDAIDEKPHPSCLAGLSSIVSGITEWEPRLKAFACEELLDNANSWAEDAMTEEELDVWRRSNSNDAAIVTPDSFKSRMKLVGLGMEAGQVFTAKFDDDDLFWGHKIRVAGSLESGPMDAHI